MSSSPASEEMEFDWVQLHQDMEKVMRTESAGEKFMRKFKENPLVPIGKCTKIKNKSVCSVVLGALATSAALGYGLWCFRTGQRRMSQLMMRTRVVAQGLTVFALIIGIGVSAKKVAIDETKETTAE